MRVVLRAGFDRFSGYGNDAVDMAVAMEKAGVDVLPMPMRILPGLPRAFTKLLEKDPRGRAHVEMTYAPPFDIRPWEYQSRRADTLRVGWSMWERTPLLPADFNRRGWPHDVPEDEVPGDARMVGEAREERWGPAPGWPTARAHAWTGLDLMLVTCPMNVEAFRHVDEITPIKVLPTGIVGDDWPVVRREAARPGPMQFLYVGVGQRKAAFTLLDAWREVKEAHPEFDARLVVHSTMPGLHPGIEQAYPDVVVSTKALDRPELLALYHASDVMVSVSRGEGMNKPAMEFMATGGTVIASDWAGHQSWLHRDVAYPLPGRLVESRERRGAQEFEVDPAALRETLLAAHANRADVCRKGERAAKWIRETHGWDVIVDRWLRQVEKVTR